MNFLGLDLGTSGMRGLMINARGDVLGEAEAFYDVVHSAPGWSEQNPSDWIEAIESIFSQLTQNIPDELGRLKAIGVSGHMHGACLLDDKNEILRPCILWNDTRSHKEAEQLDARAELRELSANIVFSGFTAPKLLWVKNNEPEIFNRVSKVLLPAAFLNLYLTGEHVCDMSDAAGTSWLDVGRRSWSQTLLGAGNMREDQMPHLVEGSTQAGSLRTELTKNWGLSTEVIVAGGAGDNAAAACGVGALNEGEGFVSLGTSGVVLTARGEFTPMPESAVHTLSLIHI